MKANIIVDPNTRILEINQEVIEIGRKLVNTQTEIEKGGSDAHLKKLMEEETKMTERLGNLTREMNDIIAKGINVKGTMYGFVYNTNTIVDLETRYSTFNEYEELVSKYSPSAILQGCHAMISEYVRTYNEGHPKKPLKVPSVTDIGTIDIAVLTTCLFNQMGHKTNKEEDKNA